MNCLGPFRALGFAFGLDVDDGRAAATVARVLAPLVPPASRPGPHGPVEPVERYQLHQTPVVPRPGPASEAREWELSRSGRTVARHAELAPVLAALFTDINRQVVSASGDRLLIHASAAAWGERGLVFPAPSGSGKSTLVAGLVRHGLRYLTDEITAVRPDTLALEAFPKSLSIEPGSQVALADLAPSLEPGPEWHIDPRSIRADAIAIRADPAFVIAPSYQAGARTRLEPIARSHAAFLLAQQAFNLAEHGPAGLDLVAALARRSACYRLVMGDLDQACALIAELVEAEPPASASAPPAPPAPAAQPDPPAPRPRRRPATIDAMEPAEIRPLAAIDGTFRPRPLGSVTAVEVDGRGVVYDHRSGELLELDAQATRVWAGFDGAATLDELAAALARGTDAHPDRVAADLVEFCKELACSGLLTGVQVDPPQRIGSIPDLSDDPVPADEIDLRFVARAQPWVATREVDGQSLVLDLRGGSICALDPLGSVVWRCFDGQGELDELVDELAQVADAPRQVVAADVVDLTRDLAGLGLLAGVAVPETDGAGPDRLEVGTPLGLGPLWDLEGRAAPADLVESGSVLVANWSPHCGYCVGLAAELSEMEGPMAVNGTTLVLVTDGSARANQDLADRTGLDGHLVRRHRHDEPDDHLDVHLDDRLDVHDHDDDQSADQDVDLPADPFAGLGTPVAYLLADGRVTEPLALGDDQVRALARRVAGRPALVDHDPGRGVRYRRAPGGVCASGGRLRTPRSWAETLTCRMGEHHVGLRTDSPATAEVVRAALAAWCVDPDPLVPANYSVVLGQPEQGRARDLRLLLEGDSPVVRSRSVRRVLLSLADHLSSWLWLDQASDLVTTRNLAVVGDGQAVLLPPELAGARDRLQPRLARLGYRLVDHPLTRVDVRRAELVVPEPVVVVDGAVLADLPVSEASRFEAPRVEPGRYPLRAWVTLYDEADPAPARVATVAAALDAVAVSPAELDDTADQLLDLFERVPLVALTDDRAEALVRRIDQVAHGRA